MPEREGTTAYTRLGALVSGAGTLFRIWSPRAAAPAVVLADGSEHALRGIGDGYFEVHVDHAPAGTMYKVRLEDGPEFPDPASRFQPEGVHGPSMVVDPSRYAWHDQKWSGVPRTRLVFYELHVGTFSPEGTFDGVRARLPYLKDLGVTALELMPVADFPGRWNWGYDHAALYAPSRAYGNPDDLRRLVDEAHGMGLAVFLDVIYNHLGPDGAYSAAFAPMFTDRHETPWGSAINLDDEHSEGVRNFFIDNALTWLEEYHFDGLRLDAVHAIVDDSTPHFLEELHRAVEDISGGPSRLLVAEDNRNLNTLVLPRHAGGYGLDAVWTDDFHHQIRNLTAGDTEGYYADFADTSAGDLAATVRQGWFYHGQSSRYSGKPRGTDASVIDPSRCVICIQNHDQVGNRPSGERLHHEIDLPVYRAASALLLFAPELPLLFMGQEWAATSPFQFFTDHDEELGLLVSEGRKKEFEHFSGFGADVPDPQDPATFERSRLHWKELDEELHFRTLNFYRDLLALRKDLRGKAAVEATGPRALQVRRGSHQLLVSLGGESEFLLPEGADLLLHSEDEKYDRNGRPPALTKSTVRLVRPGAVVLSLNDTTTSLSSS